MKKRTEKRSGLAEIFRSNFLFLAQPVKRRITSWYIRCWISKTAGPRPQFSNWALGCNVAVWVAKQLIAPWLRNNFGSTLVSLLYLLIDSKIRNFMSATAKFVTCVLWCFLSFRVGLSRSLCRPSRFLIITMSSRLQSTFWPLDRCARLMSSYLSPQFKCIIFYVCTSRLCSVYLRASGFLRSKCKDTLIKIGTSLWSTWKWCTETVLSITVRRTYTPAINISNLPTLYIFNQLMSVFMRLSFYWSLNFVITLSK